MLFKLLFGFGFLGLVLGLGTKLYLRSQPTTEIFNPTKTETAKSIQTPTQPLLKTVGWIPYWDQKTAFASFSKNVELFDFVSAFWYRIDAEGNLTTYKQTVEDQSIIDFAHKNNVKVLAVVANLPDYEEGGDWDYKRADRVISSSQARIKHISDLIKLTLDKNFDGIDIDYETLKEAQRENFSLFVEELADKLHQKGKVLGVAIHPKTSEDNPTEDNGSRAQDWARIAKVADHMYFMNYTQHSISSQPGPAGSVDWITKVMYYALNKVGVASGKIFFGIGLFGLEWHQDPDGSYAGDNDDLTFKQIQSIVKDNNLKVNWDNNVKSPNLTYQKEGEKHIVWFDNAKSVLERLKIAKDLGVAGVAFWRLGDEDQKIWEGLRKVKT